MSEDLEVPPFEFEGYELIRSIGHGGMGRVYLARDTLLDRLVAVKFLRNMNPSYEARERFFLEARAIARLQHPNVVTIHRVGEVLGRPYLVSEFVRGKSLEEVPKPLPGDRLLRIAVGLARGLAAAHRSGVLHRDIKPANAIIGEDGEVKLLDFGLAKLVEPSESVTESLPAARSTTDPEVSLSALPFPTDADHERDARPRRALATVTPIATALAARQHGERAETHGLAVSQTLAQAVASGAGGGLLTGGSAADPGMDLFGRSDTAATPPDTPARGARDLDVTHFSDPTPSEPTALDSLTRSVALRSVARGEATPEPEAPPRGKSLALTRVGVFLGTPLYTAPEVLFGSPASHRTDVYSLGALLYELASGQPPHPEDSFEALRMAAITRDAVPLAERVAIDPRLAAVVDRCLRRESQERFASGCELRDALVQLTPEARVTSVPEGPPYRGLHRFEAEHRGIFFGRDGEIGTVLERLRADSFVLIAGNSGSGKSSVCRAGIIPRILEGALGDARRWTTATLTPGKRPLHALVSGLAPYLNHLAKDIEALTAWFDAEPTSVARDLHKRLGSSEGLVIFIDQLEEVVTLGEPSEQEAFARVLATFFASPPGIRLIATVRGDFLTRVAALPGLSDGFTHALHLLRPLSQEDTREAIVGPARAKGVVFEGESMVDELVRSMTRGEGGLPLLQFALSELWSARDQARGVIPLSALQAIGGVAGSLARHADGVISSLLPEPRAAARRILLALVTPSGTSSGRPEPELVAGAPAARTALDALIRGRLLVVRELADGSICEVAHEALIREWGTLRRWIEEGESSRIARERLSAAAADWERLGRAHDGLWSARQVAECESLDRDQLHPRESDFLEASRRAARATRVRRALLAACVPLGFALVYVFMWYQGRLELNAKVQALAASAVTAVNEARAEHREVERREQEAYVLFDSGRGDAAEAIWASVLKARQSVDLAYGRGSRALENALLLDSSRQEIKGYLADVFYDRALLAERHRQLDRRDELWERIALYDEGGVRRERWSTLAAVSVESYPSGAEVFLETYATDGRGRRTPRPVRALGRTPVADVDVPSGSYRLRLEKAGHAPIAYPLLLERGAKSRVLLEMPLASEIPEGFVYVPPGPFLVGTALDEDTRRSFFTTVPIHSTNMHAYLIARNETTFADWIAYLEALPEAERRKRSPGAARLSGAFALEHRGGSRWQLMFQPTRELHSARSGEPIIYSARKENARQDWRRFPVFGVSFADLEAYAAWLSRTGRVPGARPCTEYEWERAARGADDRAFPSGEVLAPSDANFDETYARDPLAFGPDEVGRHPESRSPFEVDDLAGNVWEWTAGTIGGAKHVLRGGSYYHDLISSRSDNRQIAEPSVRDLTVGLRICADVPRH